ncbi:unnamed protein product, partial [Adineta steineri]
DKIHRVVNEKPDLFDGVSEDTSERLEHLISTVENQAAYINVLQSERDQVQEQLTSPSVENSSSIVDDYQQQIHQLQQNLSQKDEHQNLLRENFNKVEAELEQIRNDYSSIVTEYELLVQHQTQESQNSQLEIAQLKDEVAELKQSVEHEHIETQTDEDINALHELIEEQSQQMKDLNEMTSILSSQLESQIDINKEKKELEERLNERDSHIERLMEERTNLLQEIAKSTRSPIETTDNESQTEDRQQEKSTRANYKLKRSLQVVKEKIQDLVTERPDLFDDIGEDTNERLDHLISTVQNQAAYINILRSERDRVEEPLQSSMQKSQQEPDNERQTEIEQLNSSAPLSSSSIVNDYQQQINQLQQNLSQKDEERSLLRERLNEVEVEFRKTLDDHASTQNKYELLAQQQTQELQNSQHEIEQLKGEVAELKQLVNSEHVETQTDEDINALHELIEEQSQQIKDLGEINNEKKDLEERLSERETHIQNLMEEIANSKSSHIDTADNESQTDELQEGKLAQVNKKLKRSLQGIKDKIHRVVNEKPDLFDGVSEDTTERLEHLISTVDNQAAYINVLQTERDQIHEQLQNSSVVDDYQQQIHQLQQNLSEKDEQQSLLQEHLNEVQADLEKVRDDHSSLMTKHELLVQHSQHEIEELRKEVAELKQSVKCEHVETQTDEDINALHELIEEQSQQMKALNEINNEKKDLEERLNERETHIQNLMEEITNSKSSHIDTADNESQTDELQEGKGAQMNKKLKRSLQVVKDKVDRLVSEKPDLFDGVGEETNERLDHLIATVENQAAYINILQNERDQAQEQLQNLMQTSQQEQDNERQIEIEPLISSAPSSSPSIVNDHQQQIHQLQEILSEKDEQQSLLQEHLNEVEGELEKIRDDHSSMVTKYELLVQQQTEQSQNSQHEVEELRKEVAELKQSVKCEHVETQTHENINSLHELIEEQSQQIKNLGEINNEKKELEQRLNEREGQIKNLMEEIADSKSSHVETTDNECQTEELQEGKGAQMNKKLKRSLQVVKDKVDRVVSDKPDLFDGVGEETNERLDHLIATVENQAEQMNTLRNEHDQIEEQLRKDLTELQHSLETCQKDLNNEREMKTEECLTSAALSTSSETASSPVVEEYEKQIKQLEEKIIEKEEELASLNKNKAEIELRLKKSAEDNELNMTSYEERIQSFIDERNTLIEQQALRFSECEREIEELKTCNDQFQEELTELKQPSICQDVEIQTDEDINALNEMIEQQSEELKTLKENCLSLNSQIDSNAILQAETERQRIENEQQINNYQYEIENLQEERRRLLEEIQKNIVLPIQTTDNESQTDDHERKKLIKTNKKLTNTLETFQNKIHHFVSENPDLFDGIGEEVNERFDHLLTQINLLQNQIEQYQNTLQRFKNELDNEHEIKTEELNSLPSSSLVIEDYEKKTDQLQQFHPEKNKEQILLDDRLNEIQFQLRKTLNDRALTITKYASVVKENDALVEQQTLQLAQRREMEDLFDKHEKKLNNLIHDRTKLLTEMEKRVLPSIQTNTCEIQTDTEQYEQLVQLNEEMKHSLDIFQEKIHGVVGERQDIFDGISEETNERLDHLISTLEDQATQMDTLQIESTRVEEQLRNEIKDLQNALNACQYELDNERRLKVERLVSTSSSDTNNSSIIENYQKQIDQYQQNLVEKDEERNLLRDRLNEVELEYQKIQNDNTLTTSKCESLEKERDALIEQLKDLNEKNTSLLSQIELNNEEKEFEEQLFQHKKQLENLINERTMFMEGLDTNNVPSLPIENNDEYNLLLEINQNLRTEIETIGNKLDSIINTKPDLFENIGNDIHERLDYLINQVIQLKDQSKQENEKYQQLQNSFDMYRQEIENKEKIEEQANNNSTQTEIDSSTYTDVEIIKDKIQQIIQNYPTLHSKSNNNIIEDFDQIFSNITDLQHEIKELQSSYDTYRNEIENNRLIKMEQLQSYQLNDVDTQTIGLSIIEEHQKQIEKLQENELVYQREIQRLLEEKNQAQDLLSQWRKDKNEKTNIGELSNINSHMESHINEYQSQIDNLLRERLTLTEEIKQLTSQPRKTDSESQTMNDIDLQSSSSSSDQNISRHIFEQEMLAWSNESEELKRLVKQIQFENKKLKGIILKFEHMVLDYVHENERLKQENQHLSFHNYSSLQKTDGSIQNSAASDTDICYLTLKCLTYEVAQRISNTTNNEQSSVLIKNDSEQDSKQRYNDMERQMKNVCIQNERLKNQLETYTLQFKQLQHEMSIKMQDISTLKDETDRLRTSEIQYRLEADRLTAYLHDDQLKIQQLERDLHDIKQRQLNNDDKSIANLRELLELKERELNALKEKLDYTKQTHQIELQEATKANQFSLDNAKRLEQADVRNKDKRRELETKVTKFCTITRPLVENRQLFKENPIINMDELRKLIGEVDTEKRVSNTLSPIRDCLGLLEAQMRDLHHGIIENHARRSKRWKYKLGFECLACESRWEVTHDIRDLQEACLDPNRFLESSIVEPMAGCSCPIIIDFIESDVRLIVDDMIDEVTSTIAVN